MKWMNRTSVHFCTRVCGKSVHNQTVPPKEQITEHKLLPENPKNDWIGPPHPVSNLRPYYFHIPSNETPTEIEFRQGREAVQKWNQQFWESHNTRFYKSKNEFIAKYKLEDGRKEPPVEEMAKFYKQFLDENHNMHMSYNWKWYRLNFGLLWPALKVIFIRLRKKRES